MLCKNRSDLEHFFLILLLKKFESKYTSNLNTTKLDTCNFNEQLSSNWKMQPSPRKKTHISPFRKSFKELDPRDFKDDAKLWALLQWKHRMRDEIIAKKQPTNFEAKPEPAFRTTSKPVVIWENPDPPAYSQLTSLAFCLTAFPSLAAFLAPIISLSLLSLVDPLFGEETIHQMKLSFSFAILFQVAVFVVTIFSVASLTCDEDRVSVWIYIFSV